MGCSQNIQPPLVFFNSCRDPGYCRIPGPHEDGEDNFRLAQFSRDATREPLRHGFNEQAENEALAILRFSRVRHTCIKALVLLAKVYLYCHNEKTEAERLFQRSIDGLMMRQSSFYQ
jgi:hypothetical protein